MLCVCEQIRQSGEIVSNEEILKYCKLFEDEITLDNMNYAQLRALCKMLDIPVFEVSPTVLRFQLYLKLRNLEADDKVHPVLTWTLYIVAPIILGLRTAANHVFKNQNPP